MAKTTRKCYLSKCRKDGEVSEMIQDDYTDSNGKIKSRYFHPACHEKYKMIPIDMAEKASLDITIKRIHGIPGSVSPSIWQWITDVRNGTIRRGSEVIASYKDGIPFSVIEQAWLIAEEKIQWAKGNVNFRGEDEKLGELRYCFTIVKDNIPLAYHRWKKNENSKRIMADTDANNSTMPSVDDYVPKFQKQKRNDDISDFLDD